MVSLFFINCIFTCLKKHTPLLTIKKINLSQNNKQDEENETFSTDARMEPCVA